MKEQIKRILHEEDFEDRVNNKFRGNLISVSMDFKNGMYIRGDLDIKIYDGYRDIDVDGYFFLRNITKDGEKYNPGIEGESAWKATLKSIKQRLAKEIAKMLKPFAEDPQYKGTNYRPKGYSYKYNIEIVDEQELVNFNVYADKNMGMLKAVAKNLKVDTVWGLFTVEQVKAIDEAIVIVWYFTPKDEKIPFYSKHMFFDLEKELFARTHRYLNKEQFDIHHAINGTFRYHK